MIKFDATNSANWLLLWSGTFTAENAPHPYLNQFFAIPEIEVPIQIETELIAVYARAIEKEKDNNLIAWCNPHVSTGITVGGTPDTTLRGQRLLDDKVNLCRFPLNYSSSYSISLNPYWWIRQIQFIVFVYTGNKSDSYEEKLNEILNLVRQ